MSDPTRSVEAVIAEMRWWREKWGNYADGASLNPRGLMPTGALIQSLHEMEGWADQLTDLVSVLRRQQEEKAEMLAALKTVQHNRLCACYEHSGPCHRCTVGYDEVDAAIAKAEVPRSEQ